MGGKKLKLSVFTILFFGVWFLLQIPFISAQENAVQGTVEQEIQSPTETEDESPLRSAEQAILIGEDTAAAVQTGESSSIWAAVRMILVLALAAGAVYGVVFFIKRSSKQTIENDPFLKILASVHLGSNRYAHIIAVGSKAWLLGASEGGVNLIGEVDDKDVINAMLLEDSRKAAQAPSNRFPDFLAMLRRTGGGIFASGAPAETRSSGADEIRKRRERLKGL